MHLAFAAAGLLAHGTRRLARCGIVTGGVTIRHVVAAALAVTTAAAATARAASAGAPVTAAPRAPLVQPRSRPRSWRRPLR